MFDLRPTDAFRRGHVAGARSVPLAELRHRQGEIPRAGRVVLYAGTAPEAAAGYQALRDAGFRNVMVLAGGLETWIGLGLPVGPRPSGAVRAVTVALTLGVGVVAVKR